MIWDRRKIHKFLTLLKTKFLIYDNIDKFSKFSHLNPEIKYGLSFSMKKALQVFWVQWYDFLSQINYHKYLQSMDKSMCQWIIQMSIN
jgi:hypothetical protein